MNYRKLLSFFLGASLIAGCSTKPRIDLSETTNQKKAPTNENDYSTAKIETIGFHLGVSSVTVEKIAKQAGCEGGKGASLLTKPGPVEIYRMRCENGSTFLAKCELRQCKQMAN